MAGETHMTLEGCRKGGKPQMTSFDLCLARADNGTAHIGDNRKDIMATTVMDIDARIEEHMSQIDRLKTRRKALVAKEREQARKWKATCLAAIGQSVLDAAGCDWYELDIDGLRKVLSEYGEDLLAESVIEGRSPADAKRALDESKRARKAAKRDGAATESEESDSEQEHPAKARDDEQTDW